MAKFTDKCGREWVVSLDVRGFEDVRSGAGIDLQQVVDELTRFDGQGEQLGALMGDPVRLVKVLWVLCADQAQNKAPAVAPEEFGRGFGGDALEDAADALLEELVSFTRRQPRAILRAGLAKVKREQAEALPKVLAAIEAATLSTPATSAPESSGSTPAPPG